MRPDEKLMGNNGDLAQHVLSFRAHTLCVSGVFLSARVRRGRGKRLQTMLLKTELHFLLVYEGKRKKAADYVCSSRNCIVAQQRILAGVFVGKPLSSILNSTEIKEYLLKRSKRGLLSTDRAASVILPAPLFSTFVKNLRSLMSFPRDHTILY